MKGVVWPSRAVPAAASWGTNSAWSRVNKLKLVKNAHEFIMISGDPYLGGQGSLSFIFESLLLLLTYNFSQIENDLESSDRFKLWEWVGDWIIKLFKWFET